MSIGTKIFLKLLQTGVVPDKLARLHVHSMCKSALKNVVLSDVEAMHALERRIMKEISMGIELKKTSLDGDFYDLKPDFYKLFLGSQLNTSSAYFATGREDLNEAEDTKLWMSADRAMLRDGMDILEIGCSLGAMTFWMASHYPNAKITAVVDSVSNIIFLQKKINELNLKNVKIVSADISSIPAEKQFDRIICLDKLEMIASAPNWDAILKKMLKPKGKLFLQTTVCNSASYYTDTAGLRDFPGNYIYYPNLVLSPQILLTLNNFHVDDYWKISGEHAHRTAEKWLSKFEFNKSEILNLFELSYGKKNAWTWLQRWKLYILSFSEQMGYNNGQEWITAQYLLS
ncbi:MAG: methyltransferase domain-containing protein [Candidatus Riflebacteria bacterium]|nr:methyltransferase domain-containing protein [Candidatus Riflebacteria bacterium]